METDENGHFRPKTCKILVEDGKCRQGLLILDDDWCFEYSPTSNSIKIELACMQNAKTSASKLENRMLNRHFGPFMRPNSSVDDRKSSKCLKNWWWSSMIMLISHVWVLELVKMLACMLERTQISTKHACITSFQSILLIFWWNFMQKLTFLDSM